MPEKVETTNIAGMEVSNVIAIGIVFKLLCMCVSCILMRCCIILMHDTS